MKVDISTSIENINYIKYMQDKTKDGETKKQLEKKDTTHTSK